MTSLPAPLAREPHGKSRKRQLGLYVTDAEMIERLGLPERIIRLILCELEAKFSYPQKQELFGNRRYWPAVRAWHDKYAGLIRDLPQEDADDQ